MVKTLGYGFIIFGIFMGIYYTSQIYTDFYLSLFLIFLFSFPIYMLGQRLRVTSLEFKKGFIQFIGIFLLSAVITPGFLFYIEKQEEVLSMIYDAEKNFYYFSASTGMQMAIVLGLFIVIVMLKGYKVSHGWRTGSHLPTILIVILTILFFGYQYVTFDAYTGFHKELGYVTKEWNEEEKYLSYDEIDSFTVQPYVHYGRLSDPTDETKFYWKFIITPENGESFTLFTSSVSEYEIDSSSVQLKKKAQDENIPFYILPMDEEIRKWYELELKLTKANPKPYSEFFELQ